MLTYAKCAELFANRKGRWQKSLMIRLCANTWLIKEIRGYSVKYHDTFILTFRPDGRVDIGNGGYFTSTTKQRLNEYGPIQFWQRNWQWYYQHGGVEHKFDGILSIHSDGSIIADDVTV